jgi:hypothetical protein
LPDHTVQHCDPARPMTYCNVTNNRRRWEIMLMPGDDPAELVQPAHTVVWSAAGSSRTRPTSNAR